MGCDGCFLSRKPKTRRQGFIEPNCGCSIPAGADAPSFDVVIPADIIITSDVGIASGIINARPGRPSHQLG